MFCPNCGNQCNNGERFCQRCGAALNQTPNNQNNAQQNYQNNYQQPNYQQPNYQQPNYQQPGGNYQAPVKNRSVALAIVLSILTCGIYMIYWMIVLADDLNTASGRPDDTSGGIVFLLSLVTCGIYSWYWLYKCGEKVNEIQRRNGAVPENSLGILYLVLGFFGLGIVAYALAQSELNKVATIQ